MNPERWEEVGSLYSAALEREPARRAAFLAEACAGDDSLRAEVEALLKHGDCAGSFMEDSAMDLVVRELAEDSAPSEAQQVQDQLADEDGRKSRKRVPWWMYVVGAAFLICAAVHYYDYIFAPENAGITVGYIAGKAGVATGVVIKAVLTASPAAKAGLKAGDMIFTENSDGFIPSNPRWAPLYWRAGRAYHIEFKRNEETKTTILKLSRNPLRNRLMGQGKENLVVAYEMLAGTYPFAGSTALEIKDSIVGGRAIPLRTHLPEAPPAWQRFFDEVLAIQVDLRPASVLRLWSDFVGAIGRS